MTFRRVSNIGFGLFTKMICDGASEKRQNNDKSCSAKMKTFAFANVKQVMLSMVNVSGCNDIIQKKRR